MLSALPCSVPGKRSAFSHALLDGLQSQSTACEGSDVLGGNGPIITGDRTEKADGFQTTRAPKAGRRVAKKVPLNSSNGWKQLVSTLRGLAMR